MAASKTTEKKPAAPKATAPKAEAKAPRKTRAARLSNTQLTGFITTTTNLKKRVEAIAGSFADAEAKYDNKEGFVPTHLASARTVLLETLVDVDAALDELNAIKAQYDEFFA